MSDYFSIFSSYSVASGSWQEYRCQMKNGRPFYEYLHLFDRWSMLLLHIIYGDWRKTIANAFFLFLYCMRLSTTEQGPMAESLKWKI